MKLASDQQRNALNDLMMKSANDYKFKEEFIDNPKKVIETLYKLKVYDDVKLVVEDQSDENIIFLNIPRKLNLDEVELTEDELEMVAGGGTPASSTPCGVAISAAGCAVYDFCCGLVDAFRD